MSPKCLLQPLLVIRTFAPKAPCERLIEHAEANGDEPGAAALRAWRGVHDPFELKGWIEERPTLIWKLDAALNLAEEDGATDLEGVTAPFLRGLFRYAPKAPQKRKSPRPYPRKPAPKPPNPETRHGHPKSRLIFSLFGVL